MVTGGSGFSMPLPKRGSSPKSGPGFLLGGEGGVLIGLGPVAGELGATPFKGPESAIEEDMPPTFFEE